MAKAAVLDSSSSAGAVPLGKCSSNSTMKIKTPLELRVEQLKKKKVATFADDKFALELNSERPITGVKDKMKKPDSAKVPRYINMRVDEVYPVRKSSESCGTLYVKGKAKTNIANVEVSSDLDGAFGAGNFTEDNKTSLLRCNADASMVSDQFSSSAKVNDDQGFRKIEKCSQNALRNVVEVHLGNEMSTDFDKLDMEKVLKGLSILDKSTGQSSFFDSSGKNINCPSTSLKKPSTEFHVSGDRAPLDFTLKTTFRLVSSSSIKWCQKLNAAPAVFDVDFYPSNFSLNMQQQSAHTSRLHSTPEVLYSKALQSWIFPQYSLPTSIITAMTLSSSKGEADFLHRRQQDWEDSFRNLYYMLRKNICNLFYVCTSQFIALFISGKFSIGKQSCNAYISQSTHGLRDLLQKHDACFSMPFCLTEVQNANEADFVELSEIEKQNLGLAFHEDALYGVDNSPQSLLAFIGNGNVHCLYDVLLNYRSFLSSMSSCDVPALYAPVPFQNASLRMPEVKCKEMKRADAPGTFSTVSGMVDTGEARSPSTISMCYTIEIKDTILPPWVICRLCAAMSADGRTFESILATDPMSLGLNIALEPFYQKIDQSGNSDTSSKSGSSNDNTLLPLPEAVVSPCLQSAALKRLNYCKGGYTSFISQL
ncbi:hypothetical protein HPP92_011801 [Vanilla planifolia]|uniref:Protein downstream neighbor of Son-like n=1 Tax=Vanilla planifolia TaxID=51239 RepID=A0A835RD27_VANPL|nr:hypothetical protein HPP92_011801 [Vanilla planifolia]